MGRRLQHPRRLEDTVGDAEWWERWKPNGLWATPLYYRAFLDSFPSRIAPAVQAIADAGDGAVLFHCGRGRDRTGIISALVLMLADVTPEHVAGDYELTNDPRGVAEMEALGHCAGLESDRGGPRNHGSGRDAGGVRWGGRASVLEIGRLTDADLDKVERRLA